MIIDVGQYPIVFAAYHGCYGYTGTFVNAFVSKTGFKVEDYMKNANIQKLDILHSVFK